MNLYKAFYKRQSREVKAETSYEAQQKAAKAFGAKKTFEVIVMLLTKDVDGDAEPIVHSTGAL